MAARLLLVLSLPLVLAACADPDRDACADANREIGLGTLLTNTATGAYDACLDDLRGELAAMRLENSGLRARAEEARRETASLTAEQERLLAEEAALRREAEALTADASPDPEAVRRVRERQRELDNRFNTIFG